nr:MAG: RNA-dependent RNA polymerase [Totivirus monocotyledonae 2]
MGCARGDAQNAWICHPHRTGFSICRNCQGWRDPNSEYVSKCDYCGRPIDKWYRQVLGDVDGEEVILYNANPTKTKSEIDPMEVHPVLVDGPLTKSNIPVWCNIRKGKIHAVNRDKADYILVHISNKNNTQCPGNGMHRIGNEGIRSYAVPCQGLWLYYVRVNADSAGISPRIKRAMSAMYSMVEDFDFSDPLGDRFLRRWFDVDPRVIAHGSECKPPSVGEFPRAKVTSEHHTHFRPEELWEVASKVKVVRRAMCIVLERLRNIAGITESTVSTFLAYIMFSRPQVAYLIATSRKIWRAKDIGELNNILKDISTPLKSMQNTDLLDMTQIFELQSLINRGVGSINWKQERWDRINPNVVKVGPQDVYDEACKIFFEGIRRGFRYPKLELDKYVASRWEWVPSGSVHSQYQEDQAYIKKAHKHRTKFVSLNMMDGHYVKKMMDRKPEIHAWASIKYEWAKQRAIYGVDLTNTVITNFAMFRCEDVFKHKFPVGEAATPDRVHKRLKMMLEDNESFCYDFDNFNAQHSQDSMHAVLCAYRDVFSKMMTVDQRKAL